MTDAMVPAGNLLPGLIQRPAELGRIRLGEKSERGLPVRLKTFRLTSHSKATLEAAAALYGGRVQAWTDAPNEGMWQLTTAASELDILIPSSLAIIGQSLELWQGGTCERRCDGTTESISGQPCLCKAEGLAPTDKDHCDIITRLRVMLPRVPGLGVWRLDTSGYVAATEMPTQIQLLADLTPGAWIAAVLRAEQRSKRDRVDGKVETHRFVVPVISLPGMTIASVLGGTVEAPEMPAIAATTERPTAADKAATRRAQLEAQAGGSGVPSGSQAGNAPGAQASNEQQQGSTCGSASPRGEPCTLAPHETGDHRAGNKTWSGTPKQAQPTGRADEGQERGRTDTPSVEPATEVAAGVLVTPAADLPAGDVIEGEYRAVPAAGETDESVQAGLDLLKGQQR